MNTYPTLDEFLAANPLWLARQEKIRETQAALYAYQANNPKWQSTDPTWQALQLAYEKALFDGYQI